MTPALDLILQRRSTSALEGPAPTRDELATLLRAAATVPDHGELRPYRFVVVDTDEGRTRFGEALAAALAEAKPDVPPGLLEKTRKKAFAAPAFVVLIAAPILGHKIPVWEQELTAGCAGYAIALAAHAMGLGAIWKSAGVLDGAELRHVLALGASERVLGWVNVGRPSRPLEPRPDVPSRAQVLGGSGLVPFDS